MEQAIACCGSLVFIEEEQLTVHFTHSSVKQYLSSEAVDASLQHYHIELKDADANAGAVCVTYLNFGIFQKKIARTTAISENLSGVPSMVVKETLLRRGLANKIALRLLQRQGKPVSNLNRSLEEALGDSEAFRNQQIQGQYFFLSYAKRFWLEHTKYGIEPGLGKLWNLWRNLIDDADIQNTLTGVPWTHEDWMKRTPFFTQ